MIQHGTVLSRSFRSPRSLARVARLWGLVKALAWIGSYAAWSFGFRVLVLTFVTYFVVSSTPRPARFVDVSEALASNELSLLGFSAASFVVFLWMLNPITGISFREIFSPERLKNRFAEGFFHGGLVATGLALAFLWSGVYRYLGFVLQLEEAPLAIPNIALRIVAVGLLVFCEEFIFRQKITEHLRAVQVSFSNTAAAIGGRLQSRRSGAARLGAVIGTTISDRFSKHSDTFAIVATALVYCAIKAIQLDAELGWMHLVSLFLVSVALSLRTLTDGDFTRGAGFWAALLIVFHPILSLPILGNEFTGLILVKYLGATGAGPGPGTGIDEAGATTRFFTGGAGGPLSSFAFQLLLILDIVRGILRYKKAAAHNPSSKIVKK